MVFWNWKVKNTNEVLFQLKDLVESQTPNRFQPGKMQTIRQIIVNESGQNNEYTLAVPIGANNQLKICIQKAQNFGANPLEVEYKLISACKSI